MSNHGKPWLPEHDELLMHNIEKSNKELAEMLGRSAWAVECHRVNLAMALCRSDSTVSLDESIARFKADTELVQQCVEKKTIREQKRARTSRLVSPDADAVTAVIREQRKAAKTFKVSPDTSDIMAVAECIRNNQGSLAEAWANPDFVPILIKYHGGFQAFSASLAQKHHPVDPPPAQRTSPVGVPQARGAGHAQAAVAAGEEHRVGPGVDARVAQVGGGGERR
jgi:hypothetical protein